MKVAELKKTIGGYRTEQLRRLLVEMYKAMPKRVKEDHGIDDMICSPASKRNNRKSEVVPDIEALASETERFVSNAYNDYYYIPNSCGSQARAVTVAVYSSALVQEHQSCSYERSERRQGRRAVGEVVCHALLFLPLHIVQRLRPISIRRNLRKRIFFERCYSSNDVMKIRENLFGAASSWP